MKELENTYKTPNYDYRPKLAGKLMAGDFDKEVTVHFDDSSYVHFTSAFVKEEADFVVVYTEHCGYHVFPKESITFYGG